MNIRPATEADGAPLRALWEEYEVEVPEPPGFLPEPWEQQWTAIQKSIGGGGAVYVAEEGDAHALVAVVHVLPPERGVAHVEWAHVRRDWRRRGVAKALLRECVRAVKDEGTTTVSLEALRSNEPAIVVWERLGFEVVEFFMAAPVERLELRLADVPVGTSHASTHVQTDDRIAVERALAQFIPSLHGAEVAATTSGWMRIIDALLHVDRDAQARLARDLSERLGAVVVALAVEVGAVVRFRLYERGRMVDEYLSVPGFYGELPKGDELALAANPTLVARLTGADRDEVRIVARTAATPAELPPAHELYEQIARTMGLEP